MLKNKIALVTGSTSGIGLGIARALAREGVHLMLHGLGDPAETGRLRDSLAQATGVTVRYHDADVSRAGEVARLVAETEAAFGALDILVNNAGVQFVSPVEDFPPERWSGIQEIILNATFHAIRAAIPGMKRRGWGRIINLASVHGLVASPFKSAYVAAKHGRWNSRRRRSPATPFVPATCAPRWWKGRLRARRSCTDCRASG
jgi:3-hydroxybutyrate dehydrogenase